MKNIILLSLLIFLLFSCSSNIDKKPDEKLRLETLNNLALHYGAVVGFDTLHFPLTIQYQNFLNKNNKIILDKFKITDVTKYDSIYIISIEKGYSSKLFIDLTCTEPQVQEILADTSTKMSRHIRVNNKYIVAIITSIHKVKYKINSNVESDGEEEPSAYLELDASDAFICKGKLISVYKNSKQ